MSEPATRDQELRRDVRFNVNQAALITRPGQSDITCEIRDFCLGGLYLKLTPANDDTHAFALLADTEAEIIFNPALPSEPAQPRQLFRIQAQLKRANARGIGVAFARQPVDALRALQKLRMAHHRQRLAAATTAPDTQDLRETCSTLLRETLIHSHGHLSRIMDDKLNLAALYAVGMSEHSGLLNARFEFQTRANTIQEKLLREVLEQLNPQTPIVPLTHDQLALVDEMDFEDWLATSAEVTRLEAHFKEQLADIEPRVSQLFGQPFDHLSNPFGPSVICHTYRNAVQEIPTLAKARAVAYSALQEVLTDQLAPLYAELLSWLPVSDAELAQHGAITRSHQANKTDKSADLSAASKPPTAQGTLGRLASSLLEYFRGDASKAASAQATAENDAKSSPAPHAAPETSPVLQRLSAAGALPQNLNPEMRQSVDMFGALFDTLHVEKSLSQGIRPFFCQLETSLVKLAISDPEFLGSPSHPAHKVLNTLDRIGMIAGDDGNITDARLLRLMGRWTDRINAEAEKNPGIFEEARTQLERVVKPLLQERIARIARLQEICEGRQRAELTKTRIVSQLLETVGAREVPNVIVDLINNGWRNVLLMAELRHGEHSAEARAAWGALDQLSQWLDPSHTEGLPPAVAQALLQYIDTALGRVCADKFAQDRMLDQLSQALFDHGYSAQFTNITAKLQAGVPEAISAGQGELLEKLRVGDWLQFPKMDAPLNLVWVGNHPSVYVFANYRGIKKIDIKRHDLLQALEQNEVQWTEDIELPLMDRTYSAMIQKMQRDLIRQASHDPGTGLANRRAFFRSIRREWVRNPNTQLDTGYMIGIIQAEVLDMDGTSPNADTRNAFMREMAKKVQQQLPAGSLLARAGEQSIAYWVAMSDTISAKLTSTKLLNALNRFRLSIDQHDIHTQAYIGLIWANNGLHPESYYDHANAAATAAREAKQSGVVLYQNNASDRTKPAIALTKWAHYLTHILAENRLALDCQALRNVHHPDAPVQYEILLHPIANADADSDPIHTRNLISVAERLRRITEIDRWVFKQLIQWMRVHPEQMETIGGLAIKISGLSVANPLFLNFLLSELGRGDLPADKIIFKLSESAASEGHSQTQYFVRQLQRVGCKLMLDEFGLGSSSYTALKSLKVDYLKLDLALVREVSSSLIDESIVRSIMETCSSLGIQSVAGYVENEDTQTKLIEMGVQYLQGYLISEPESLTSLQTN